MGAKKVEKTVLKLVHPGRHVETHTKPIYAAEILNKYPRYCITRPDVFKFPWIVVKPESLLVPGKIFFLVPKRSVYKLLVQAYTQSYYNHDQLSFSSTAQITSPSKSSAGMTPKHQTHLQFQRRHPKQADPDSKRRENNHSQFELSFFPNTREKTKKFHARERCYRGSNSKMSNGAQKHEEDVYRSGNKQGVKKLKSCLRKPDSACRPLHLRVTFLLPNRYEEPPGRRVGECQSTESAAFLNW